MSALASANRLEAAVQTAVGNREKLFCAFLTFGYPSVPATESLIRAFEKEGADIIELGFPFSDPLADGPTIQFSSQKALEKHVRIRGAFDLVRRLRRSGCRIPIVFFGYLNPVLHYGLSRFAKDAASAGIDGLVVPDLPPGAEPDFEKDCRRRGLAQIFFVAPTTGADKARAVAAKSRGFIYYVSLRGVTGSRAGMPRGIGAHLALMKKVARLPFLIGFGVSAPEQARRMARLGQGVIVGSAIIDRLRKAGGRPGPAVRFVRGMVRSVKGKS